MLQLDSTWIKNRLILGTALFPSLEKMVAAITTAEVELITVSLRRQLASDKKNRFWDCIRELGCRVLPNTAGCQSVQEAVTTAKMARELFQTNWIKLEVIGDQYNLQPDPFGLLEATEILINDGFHVFPYCTDDLVLCQRLVAAGCRIVMPWASPIGSGLGILNPYALQMLRQRLPDVTLIIDAGIRSPSQAAQMMELGFDAVLLNSAVALADDPVNMACAFREAVQAGRRAHQAGLMPQRDFASPSTPLCDTPFWQQELAK